MVNVQSGVASVPCALGQEIFLRSSSTKTAKFEVKNKCKSAEEAEHLLQLVCSIGGDKTHSMLEKNLLKL